MDLWMDGKDKFPIFIGINGIIADCSSGLFGVIKTFISSFFLYFASPEIDLFLLSPPSKNRRDAWELRCNRGVQGCPRL
jgi:hypothetical protein